MNEFTEKQKFRQWWLWLIILATLIFPVVITLNDSKLGYKSHSVQEMLVASIIPVVIIVLFLIMELRTRIDATGIYYRFFPIHLQVLRKGWDEVEKVYIRQYKPILEYGGWGIRLGLGGKGKAYNIAGNIGLQLELTNGKKILIGTQKPDEILELLEQLVKNKVITRKMITPDTQKV